MIIDTHVHIGEFFQFYMPEEYVLGSMKTYGIDYSIVSDIRGAEFGHQEEPVPPEFQVSQLTVAASAVDMARRYPDKIGAAIWVKPFTETPDEPLRRLIRENRPLIKAMKIHPFHSTVPFDDPRTEAYLRLAAEWGLPIVTHTGGSDAAACIRVFRMAKKHPELSFVMVHMGLGTDHREAEDLIGQLPNLYGDTTWVPMEHAVRFIRRWGPEKLLFGSDNPIDGKNTYRENSYGQRSIYQDYFHVLPTLISDDAYQALMYRNAQRLFSIDLPSSQTN